ncbi:hypothetical protein R3P38DRAFT_3183767 [Favolaschia claudopus]|uniref:Uncharacterized protein n=1 Tax=Favolaschia claudopus TaxID=2862362 RepID=A0AAW0CBF7_9AGAR
MSDMWLRDIYLPPFVEDQELLTLDPLAAAFRDWEIQTTVISRLEGQRRRKKLVDGLKTDVWFGRINNWLSLVLGGDVPEDSYIEPQIELFIDVMWSRFFYKDSSQCRSEVLKILGPARKTLGVQPYDSTLGCEFSLAGDLNANDIASLTPSRTPDVHALVFGDESDLSDLSGDELANDDDVHMGVPFKVIDANEDMPLARDVERTSKANADHDVSFEEHARIVEAFFFPAVELASEPRNCKTLVDALVKLRKIEELCDPFHPLENSHPDVQQSFRLYDWKSAYGDILDRWSPLDPSVPVPPLIEQGPFEFDADDFLRFFGTHVEIHPWVAYPSTCTFLVSEDSFKANAEHWLLPWLKCVNYRTIGWDLNKVYRSICKHPIMEEGNDNRRVRRLLKEIDPRFAAILLETRRYRATVKTVNAEVFKKSSNTKASPTPAAPNEPDNPDVDPTVADPSTPNLPSWFTEKGCGGCMERPESERCIRFVPVTDHSDAMAKYVDYALTVYGEHERLQPKERDGSCTLGPQNYVTPQEIGLVEITPRAKDHAVGGFRYNAFAQPTLDLLNYNARRIKTSALRRRAAMQRWDYGKMSGEGSRMPAGGRKGDGYMPYNVHRGDTIDDIKAFFRSALDNDLLIVAAKTIYQGIESDFKHLTNDAGLHRLGKYGLTSYYCENYIAPVHRDLDIEEEHRRYLHPCMQLVKEGCSEHDFNFAYVDWGVYFRTESNCVW